MSTETVARPADTAAPKPTEFTDAEHSMLDAMNVPTNRQGRALLFREMQRTGLDPFAKHLYLREDWNKNANRNVYAVASTIDGFRIAAARQPTYEGQTAPQWCDKNGRWTDAWYVDAPPVAARIGVYVRGYREPMWGIARFNEYKPNGGAGFMWGKMPALMIAKVAEALAIRKAYPDQLSGVYTDDEMQQADARRDEESPNGAQRPARRQGGHANDEWNSVPPQAIAEQQDRDAEAPQDGPAEWDTATGQPLPPPSPSVPSATGDQITEMVRLLGVKRHVYNGHCAPVVSQLVQRPIGDPGGLSQAEIRTVIETLNGEDDWTTPAPGTPDNPVIGRADHRQMQALFKTAGITERDDQHAFIQRVLRLDKPLASRNDITKEQFKLIRHALSTGEVPPADPAPAAPNANGEGISEFDVLNQMILDINGPQSLMDTHDAIAAELQRGTITASDAELLGERIDAHVKQAQAKAGASA